MDVVQEYLDIINYHWFVIVGTGMYIHLREKCLVGLCFGDIVTPSFDHFNASTIFMFAVMCLLTDYSLWPNSLKKPPLALFILYEVSSFS